MDFYAYNLYSCRGLAMCSLAKLLWACGPKITKKESNTKLHFRLWIPFQIMDFNWYNLYSCLGLAMCSLNKLLWAWGPKLNKYTEIILRLWSLKSNVCRFLGLAMCSLNIKATLSKSNKTHKERNQLLH